MASKYPQSVFKKAQAKGCRRLLESGQQWSSKTRIRLIPNRPTFLPCVQPTNRAGGTMIREQERYS
eukprot:scaffold1333_cov17-Tisochrysis_lutea.AAC.1